MQILLRLFKALVLASFVGVILLVGWVAISMFLDNRAGKAFAEVKMGASTQDVVALLGKPDVVRPCGENLWWGGDGDYRGKNDGRCVTEVRYTRPSRGTLRGKAARAPHFYVSPGSICSKCGKNLGKS